MNRRGFIGRCTALLAAFFAAGVVLPEAETLVEVGIHADTSAFDEAVLTARAWLDAHSEPHLVEVTYTATETGETFTEQMWMREGQGRTTYTPT